MKHISFLFLLILLVSCQPKPEPKALSDVPEWTKEAIWYQIFVERFRNGDESNDPTRESLLNSYPNDFPETWSVTPWTQQWYKPNDWMNDMEEPDLFRSIQARRYGGDLQGVKDKIPYLKELGINAIYFNPLNDAPSLHKYDAAHYRHIDRHFGPDPDGDTEIINAETPDDPSTWQWTAADKLFLDIIKECKENGIRIVLDYSWNHTGSDFWAFLDVMEKGNESKYKDWYYIEHFDDPSTPENEFHYEGWAGVPSLPELKENIIEIETEENELDQSWGYGGDPLKIVDGDIYDSTLKAHIFHVTQRWLDPNGDGDPSDGIDGYRLDVAAEVPIGFWEDYREFVRSINPEAYLIGEVWWEQWPDKLMDPAPFLGNAFDAVMNYRWYRFARQYLAQAGMVKKPSEYVEAITKMNESMGIQYTYAMMNVTSSHDVPRLSTSLQNKNNYKNGVKPTDNPDYNIHKPTEATMKEMKMMLLHQFSYVGGPQIWNGEEMGMWGADDPSCRKPLIWPDYEFEAESYHPLKGETDYVEEVKMDSALFEYYKTLCKVRTENKVLSLGDLNFTLADDDKYVLAYSRVLGKENAIAVFNVSEETQSISVPAPSNGKYVNALNGEELSAKELQLAVEIPAKSGLLYLHKN
jgi:cyclomaltodextrinase